ncbi:MAG: porin [Thiothrix sp.]|uniref:porin n=1 Tax=Thiothrix sp. TaxID=1032 RepID=UPI00260E7602|nr:porin [Thiothrix sp.]MDD5394617.1 porin [Thiothrix sp.]
MKKLLVIAVAAALAAPAAMADTTLYGKLHASVGSVKTTTGTVSTTSKAVESHSSRLGVKGSTALDNGMEATYGLEYGLNLDGDNGGGTTSAATGTAAADTLTSRNTFVGLKGKFGEVRVGKHDTPAKLATAGQDVFADTYADMSNIVNADQNRVNNAVAYINKFGPVTFATAYTTSGIGAADTAGNAHSTMLAYGNGPWSAALGYTAVKTNVETAAAVQSVKQTNLGLGWKSEAGHAVNLIMENDKNTNGTANTSTKEKTTLLNGVYKMGNVGLKAQVGSRKGSGAANADANGTEKLTSVGVDYSLGKKTSVYLLSSSNKNTGAVSGAALKTDTKATAIGLVTEF